MGTIISNIESIRRIRWTKPNEGQVLKASRIMFIDETTAIIELESGKFTVAGRRNSPNGNWTVLGYGLNKFTGAVLNGLVRMGILTKQDVSDHKRDVKARSDAYNRGWREKAIREHCKSLKLTLPVEMEK